MVERILLIATFIVCASGFTWVALKVQREQAELAECKRTNIKPPVVPHEEYLWSVVFQRTEGQLDTMEVMTNDTDTDFGIFATDNSSLLVTVDGGGIMSYQACDAIRILEIKLIAD